MRKPKLREYLQEGCTQVLSRLIMAEPAANDKGYSWTLAAALGEMLLIAEEKFGARDISWTVLGIDFIPENHSKIWFPGNCKHIIIQLDSDARMDRQYAYYELAHECIHLLSPTGKADANFLEEGLAAYFSRWYTHYIFGDGWWMSDKFTYSGYAHAFTLVEQLLNLDADIIKKFREVQPVISRLTTEQMLERSPAVPRELAYALEQRFTLSFDI